MQLFNPEEQEEVDLEDIECITPLSPIKEFLETSKDTVVTTEEKEHRRDPNYIPQDESYNDSDLVNIGEVIYGNQVPRAPAMPQLSEEDQVKENKFSLRIMP